MSTPYTPRMRPERLVVVGRVVLASSSLFAVWLDPAEPAKHSQVAYSLLAAYLGYATLVALHVWRWEAASARWRVATHAFDLLFFSLFIYFTEGPSSPFVAYFVFALVCATVRWQSRGALWTAVASLLAYFAAGVYFSEVLDDPAFELNGFIIRAVYLGVVALLLGYLGSHELQTRRDLIQLAAAPQSVPEDLEPLVRELFEYAATVLKAPRVVAVWREQAPGDATALAQGIGAGWLNLAVWHAGAVTWSREAREIADPMVADQLGDAHFICGNVRLAEPVVRYGLAPDLEEWRGAPLSQAVVSRFDVRSVVALRLVGTRFDGRIFLLDKTSVTVDDLVLGEILGGVVAARLDNFYLTRQLRAAAASEERVRLARDLHDGTLQSFAGIALRLETVRRLLATGGGEAAGTAVEELQLVIASEQRDLRFFIQELEPSSTPGPGLGTADTLAQKLGDLVERMDREWDLTVELHADGLLDPVSDALARNVYHIVREALVNAARHGQASQVRIEIRADEDDRLEIVVADNGRGFPFDGTLSAEALAERQVGPRSLCERVASLAGSLTVQSSPAGARLDVLLPFSRA